MMREGMMRDAIAKQMVKFYTLIKLICLSKDGIAIDWSPFNLPGNGVSKMRITTCF